MMKQPAKFRSINLPVDFMLFKPRIYSMYLNFDI